MKDGAKAALIAGALVVGLSGAAAAEGYKLVKTIDLPGSKGGHGDWVTYDRGTDTVWLAQAPDHDVVVLDARTMTVKGVIPGIEEGNGIATTPRYAFLADGKGNAVVVVDKKTMKKVATLKPAGKTPDSVNYLGRHGEVYVSSDSNEATVYSDRKPFKERVHFALKPNPAKDGPDVALYVSRTGYVYQPVDNAIDVIEPGKWKIETVWKPGIEKSAKPMVYDRKTGHLIAGTTDKKMLVLDARTGKKLGEIPVAGAVDETAIDETARRAFVGDKAGVIEVIDLDTDKVVGKLPAEKNVHTLAVDTRTHAIFVYMNESNKVNVFEPEKTAAK